jgi:hypothetical protein
VAVVQPHFDSLSAAAGTDVDRRQKRSVIGVIRRSRSRGSVGRLCALPWLGLPWTALSDSPGRALGTLNVAGELVGRFPRMAFWPPEVPWHERDVVVPTFRRWLETQGWDTETETGFVDVVAQRGNETIYAEVKGRTKSRPGAGLDTLYGQLLRRMPVEEVGDPNTRFAVVIPTGAGCRSLTQIERMIG